MDLTFRSCGGNLKVDRLVTIGMIDIRAAASPLDSDAIMPKNLMTCMLARQAAQRLG
jgi:hypothetical protein